MPPKTWPTHVALIIVQVAFAAGSVEGKLAMGREHVTPFALAMARMLGAAIFFQLAGRAFGALSRTTLGDQARLVGLSLLGVVVNQALFLLGLSMTSAFSATLLGATIPVFSAGFAILFGQERPSWQTAVGLTIAFSGVVWLTGIRRVDVGAVVVAVNCVAYSLYIVLGRSVIRRLGSVTVVTWMFTWGAVLFAPLGAPALVRGALSWSPRAWALVAFIIGVQTVLAYGLNAWALGRSTATIVTIYIYLQPLLAALLAWAQLGDRLTSRMVVACALIFAGVTVVLTRVARAGPARRQAG